MAEKVSQLTSTNQTDGSSLFASLAGMLHQNKLDTDGMLPARVVSFDRKSNVAEVKPVIHFAGLQEGQTVPRDPLTHINVLSLGGGGFHLSFPLKPGDLGWIFASDRDLSDFTKDLAEGPPRHGQARQFTSGLFIPDVFRQYVIDAEDDGAMVIQSVDGKVKLSLHDDNIVIAAPTKILLRTPLTEISDKLVVQGLATFNGGVTAIAGQAVSLPAETEINGIVVIGHGHEQNGDSGRTSGGMEA